MGRRFATTCVARRTWPSYAPCGGLAAHGEPDFIAQLIEILIEHRDLALASSIYGHLEFLHDSSWPLRHHEHALGQVDRLVDVMGDHHDGLAGCLPQAQQFVLHHLARLGVERAERLIQQQDLWIVSKRAGDRHALFHAARQFARKTVLEALQPDGADKSLDGLFAPLARRSAHLEAVADILRDGQPRKERILLEDDAAIDTWAGHRLAIDLDGPAVRADKASKNVEERAFAAAGRSDDSDELTFRNGDVHVGERCHVAVPRPITFVQMLDAYADHAEQAY